MLAHLVLFAALLCIVHILCNYNGRARMIKKMPGPRDDFIIGNGITVIRSSVGLMELGREYARTWNGIYRIWAFPIAAVIIYNPEDVEKILSNMKYSQKSPLYNTLKPWLRDGLLISNGVKWQSRRKIITPAFHFNILRQFFDVLVENSHRLLQNLRDTSQQSTDVVPLCSDFTLNSICETAMGTQLNTEVSHAGKSYKEAIHQMGTLFFERLIKIYFYADFIYNLSPQGRKQKKHLRAVHNFTEKVIKQRKECLEKNGVSMDEEYKGDNDDENIYIKKRKTAMLDLLLIAEKQGLIDKMGVQEEVDTFMFEGHDTTASGLTFCFLLLANHREVQDNIVAELKQILGDTDRPIKMEDLAKMHYMERCIKESMRLYPPVHFISRSINETTTLSDYEVPAGTHCHILIYDLHRREDLFPNPEHFDPDRFLPKNVKGRHPYAYVPFSAGPRNCIGQKFAMMEMKVAVSQVLREFILEPVTRPEDLQFLADLVLRNNGPVCIKFVKRHRN